MSRISKKRDWIILKFGQGIRFGFGENRLDFCTVPEIEGSTPVRVLLI